MARFKDANDRFNNVKWDGVDPDVINFRNELTERFPQMRVTSALRTGNGVGKAGSKSRHNRGEALDLGVDKDLHKFLYSAEGDALLRKYNLGFLDESLDETRKHTGATGPHFHIGKDSTLSGNSNKFNKAFSAVSSLTQPSSNETPEKTTPETDMGIPETPDTSPEFFEKIYMQHAEKEAQLAAQYEQEKASADRQNAIQVNLQKKIEHRNTMLEMIQGHELGTVSRTKQFAEGGEFEGLNDNLKFKLDAIKANTPDIKFIDPTQSETYQKLLQTRSTMQSIAKSGLEAYKRPLSVQQNPVVGEEEVDTEDHNHKSVENTSVAAKLYNRLSELGLKTHQISGVLGSLSGESTVNLSATALNPSSKAFGIAQWLGSRLVGLKEFGKERGRDFKNEDIQIEYLLHELQNTSEKKSLQAIKKAKNVEEATMIWTRQFERPSESEIQKSIQERVTNAKMFQSKFS